MVTKRKTGTKRKRSRSQKFKKAVLGRPQGVIQARVQAVGPEKFGIVSIEHQRGQASLMIISIRGQASSMIK